MAQQDMQNLIQDWMEQQQKLWQGWMQNVQQASGGTGAGQPWAPGLSQWQQAVTQTLATQKQATRAWAEKVAAVEGAPPEMKKWATDGVRLLDQWADAQEKLWQQWFEMMSSPGTGGEQMEQLRAGWEQMSSQMQALQRQWTAAFSGISAAAGPKSEGAKKK